MGGYNSGRPRRRAYLGQQLSFGIKDVCKYFGNTEIHNATGTMTWGNGSQIGVRYSPEGMRLSFASNGTTCSQQINVAYTSCHFGGKGRPWMLCGCGKRTGKLFLAGGTRFVCRKCTGMAYQSQSLSPLDRGTWEIRKHQKRLDPAGRYEIWDFPTKPKGMHHSTYDKVTDKLIEAMATREGLADMRCAKVLRRLGVPGLEALIKDPEPEKKAKGKGFWG